MPFHSNFSDGLHVSGTEKGKILFIGDSVMQQYVEPIATSLGFTTADVDTATRGLCVMLKDVQYADQIGNMSCDELRSDTYELDKSYEFVVISQAWQGYGANVKNFRAGASNLFDRWDELLAATVAHFRTRAKHVVIIGAHPIIDGSGGIRSRVFMTEERYRKALKELRFANVERLHEARLFFDDFAEGLENVTVIHPEDIFCQSECRLRGEKWSYFGDSVHISSAALPFVTERFDELLQPLSQSPSTAIEEAQ